MTSGRLERVLDERSVVDLGAVATDQLRSRRAEAEAEEEAVSYVRRLLQGRLDILHAELERRRREGSSQAADLLTTLSAALASGSSRAPTEPVRARATRLRVPIGIEEHTRRLDDLFDPADPDPLGDRPIEHLEMLVTRISEQERELSDIRQTLFSRIDTLRAELMVRYKDGRAGVDELLAEQ